jgi:hypothetical protein
MMSTQQGSVHRGDTAVIDVYMPNITSSNIWSINEHSW